MGQGQGERRKFNHNPDNRDCFSRHLSGLEIPDSTTVFWVKLSVGGHWA